MAKKKQGKTEKKLRGQLKYRKSKLKKVIDKELPKLDLITVKGKKRQMFEGRMLTRSSIESIILRRIYSENSKIDKLESSLERFGYIPRYKKTTIKKRKGQLSIQIGFVWEFSQNLKKLVLKNTEVRYVDGFNKKTELEKILFNSEKLKILMSSNDIAYYVETDTKNMGGVLTLQNKDYYLHE